MGFARSGSVHRRQGADDAVADEAGEVGRAGVEPAQVHVAAVAQAERPGVVGEPSVFQRRHAGFATANRPRKGDDVEPDAFGVFEGKLALAVAGQPVLFAGHAVEAPGTKPVVGRVAGTRARARLRHGFHRFQGSSHRSRYRFNRLTHAGHDARTSDRRHSLAARGAPAQTQTGGHGFVNPLKFGRRRSATLQ